MNPKVRGGHRAMGLYLLLGVVVQPTQRSHVLLVNHGNHGPHGTPPWGGRCSRERLVGGRVWAGRTLGVPPPSAILPRSWPSRESWGEHLPSPRVLFVYLVNLVPILPILTGQYSRPVFTDCMSSIAVLDFVENSSSGGITSSNV